MGVIGQVGQYDSYEHMVGLPLWAYLPHRSTQDPLLRVAQHCRAARALVASCRSTPFTRARGQTTPKASGAVQLLIDMSHAFDSVDRNLLFSRLASIGVRPEVVKLLQHWHHDSCYVVQSECNQSFIPVAKGVRQGCRAAPWLWNAFLTVLLTDLSADIDIEWLRAHVNFFADDGQIGALFHTEAEMYYVLHCVGHLLFLLQQFGLVINEHKSQILFTLTGTDKKRIRRQITTWDESQEMLCVSFAGQQFQIPIKQSAKYLGTIISYGNLEDQTTRHRVHLANVACSRLSKWLTCKHGMHIKRKLHLWTTCVLPIATYGLFSIGLTSTGATLLYRNFCKMLRKIVGDHSYRTLNSNIMVLQKYNLADPYAVLWHTAERLKWSVTQRLQHLSQDDLVHSMQWNHIDDIQSMLWNLHQAADSPFTLVTQEDTEALRCHQCQYETSTVAALRQHYALHHGLHMYRTHFIIPSEHALFGLPQCKHCMATFKSWRTFSHHLERGCQAILRHPEQFVPVKLPTDMPLLPTRISNARSDEAMRGQIQLSAADLRNIASQEWGHRLLQLIGSRQLNQLRHEDAVLEYLSQRCCLCAQWVGRSQEMHRHMRMFHSQFWPMVMAKSTQLSNRFAGESPCHFCHGIFKTSHSCNVWTQVSLLIIYGAGTLGPHQSLDAALTCELCDQTMSTAAELHSHLMQEHSLSAAKWNPSRDALEGCPGCAHCGMVFTSLESLRSHISQGRCECFDPSKTCEPTPIDPQLLGALCDGGFNAAINDYVLRQQLTLCCQCCSMKYARAGDLMLHLQTSHSQIWQESAHLSTILTGMFSDLGCVCNPGVAAQRLNHTCVPLRQLAMQFVRQKPPRMFMPLLITDDMLSMIYHPGVPRDLKFAIDKALIDRDLDNLLRSMEHMQHLCHRCLLCARWHTPIDLILHLREAHGCCTDLISFFVMQLLPAFLHDNPMAHQCRFCDMIFNLPLAENLDSSAEHVLSDRVILAQNHFRANCPAALQLAVVLCKAFNNGRLQHERRLGFSSDSGGIPTPGTTPGGGSGSRSSASRIPGAAETSQKRRRTQEQTGEAGAGHRGRRSTGSTEIDGTHHGSAGPGPAGPTTRNHIYLLLQQSGTDGIIEVPSDGSGVMAQGDHAEASTDAVVPTTPTAVPGAAEGTGGETQQPGILRPTVGPHQESPGEQCAAPRHELPLLGMGSGAPETETQQSAHHQPEEDAAERPGTQRDEHGPRLDPGLPHPATERGNHSLETSNVHSRRPGIQPDEGTLRLKHMGLDGDKPASTHLASEHAGESAGEKSQSLPEEGVRQREAAIEELSATDIIDRIRFLDIVAHASFSNSSNWCFANSTVAATLWSGLSMSGFDEHTWGKHRTPLTKFVLQLANQVGDLATEPWFLEVLRCWGEEATDSLTSSIRQQDAAELISSWMQQMETAAYSMHWERRMMVDDQTHKIDESDSTLPLFLQFTPLIAQLPRCNLTDLVKAWQNMDGMAAALTCPAQGICCHIDRCVQLQDAPHVCRCSTIIDPESDCLIPTFLGEGISTGLVEFTPVALQAHLGSDAKGHYRTALRIQPTITKGTLPTTWLLCDDWMAPTPLWTLPDWFLSHVNVVWLVRSDQVALHMYAESVATSTQPSAVDAMLALLSKPAKR